MHLCTKEICKRQIMMCQLNNEVYSVFSYVNHLSQKLCTHWKRLRLFEIGAISLATEAPPNIFFVNRQVNTISKSPILHRCYCLFALVHFTMFLHMSRILKSRLTGNKS